jgi:hypothetical protein
MVWIRLMGLPFEMRGIETLQQIAKTLGQYIQVDDNTRFNFDIRWARVCVAVHDKFSIAPTVPFNVKREGEEPINITVRVEVETPNSEPLIDLSVSLPDSEPQLHMNNVNITFPIQNTSTTHDLDLINHPTANIATPMYPPNFDAPIPYINKQVDQTIMVKSVVHGTHAKKQTSPNANIIPEDESPTLTSVRKKLLFTPTELPGWVHLNYADEQDSTMPNTEATSAYHTRRIASRRKTAAPVAQFSSSASPIRRCSIRRTCSIAEQDGQRRKQQRVAPKKTDEVINVDDSDSVASGRFL